MRNCLHCIRYCMALLLLFCDLFFKIFSVTRKNKKIKKNWLLYRSSTCWMPTMSRRIKKQEVNDTDLWHVIGRFGASGFTAEKKKKKKKCTQGTVRVALGACGWVPIRSQQQHETDGRHTEGMLERTLCSSLWMDARTEHTSGNFLRTPITIIGYEKVDGTVSLVAL